MFENSPTGITSIEVETESNNLSDITNSLLTSLIKKKVWL